jgi:DNA-binding NarL/FixJ family response regulator
MRDAKLPPTTMPKAALRILIVDDHPMFRRGLREFLLESPLPCDLLEAASAEEALEKLTLAPVDLVVSDLNLPTADGFWLLEQISQLENPVPLLFLTMDNQCSSVLRALELGARGFMNKKAGTSEIIEAITACHVGRNYLHSTVAHCVVNRLKERVPQESSEQLAVTPREIEVLEKVALGDSNEKICSDLCISSSTLKTHMRSLYRKLGVAGRTKLVLQAIQLRLVPES